MMHRHEMEWDMTTVPLPEQVFTEETFGEQFLADAVAACVSVQIESAYITVDRVKKFSYALTQCLRKGAQVCAFVQKPEDWDRRHDNRLNPSRRAELVKTEAAVELMKSYGAHVTVRPVIHQKLAVIDYRITWAGGLNILSYTRLTSEEIYRWTDVNWAQQTVKRRRYDECPECCAKIGGRVPAIRLQLGGLGTQISELRNSKGLSQRELAAVLGVRRQTLADIECGKHFPRGDLLIRIYEELDAPLVTVPPDALPIIQKWISIRS